MWYMYNLCRFTYGILELGILFVQADSIILVFFLGCHYLEKL